MSGAPQGRGRLSSFDLLPAECDPVITWAAQALADRSRTQTDIYAEFVTRCEDLQKEYRGELDFRIPSFSSFNRHAVRMARLTRRLDQTRAIVESLAEKFDPAEADNLTIMAAETVKALVLHMLAEADEDSIDPRGVMQLASALRHAMAAQSVSSDRRRRVEADLAARLDRAVSAVARVKGLSAGTAEAIRAQILGVDPVAPAADAGSDGAGS